MNEMPVRDFLDSLGGQRVFFDPLSGNHGDRLLHLAAQTLIDQAPFTLAPSPQSADYILVNGGGSMVDEWFGLERLARYSKDFPSHPLGVLPSSFRLGPGGLADIVRMRQAPMCLWARERPSLDVLRDAVPGPGVTLGLDHDLAFSLDQHPVITTLRNTPVEDLVLIVERDDWEGPTGRRRILSPPGLEFIPENFRTAVRKTLLGPLRKRQDRKSPFRAAALRFVNQRRRAGTECDSLAADISLAETCSFEDFLNHVARASIIVTTRLHVAILGHLLNRETWLVEGSYHKYRGVYEFSMQQGSTRLARWNGRELES